jgi:biotin carboxyl carrier protein
MKMLNPIIAERPGVIAKVNAELGMQVNPDDVLIEFEP